MKERNKAVISIYKIVRNNDILYIGQALDFNRRKNHHFTRLAAGKHKNIHLQRIHDKYGGLEMLVVEEVSNKSVLTSREIHYIKLLKPICNMQIPNENDSWTFTEDRNRKISESNKGKPKSAEHRANIAKAKLGKNNPMYGKIPWNKGNSEYMSGEKNHFFGKKHTEESKLKISMTKRGVL